MLNAFLPNPTTNIIIIIFESVFDWMFSWTFGRCVLVWWKGDLYLCQCETDHATYQQEHQVHSYRVTWIGKIIWPKKHPKGFGAASVNAQRAAPWNTEPLRVGALVCCWWKLLQVLCQFSWGYGCPEKAVFYCVSNKSRVNTETRWQLDEFLVSSCASFHFSCLFVGLPWKTRRSMEEPNNLQIFLNCSGQWFFKPSSTWGSFLPFILRGFCLGFFLAISGRVWWNHDQIMWNSKVASSSLFLLKEFLNIFYWRLCIL